MHCFDDNTARNNSTQVLGLTIKINPFSVEIIISNAQYKDGKPVLGKMIKVESKMVKVEQVKSLK